MKDCPNCNYPNDDENKFCRECGTKLDEAKNYCPYCNRIFIDGEKFCVECGTKLVAKSQYNKTNSNKQHTLKKPEHVEESNTELGTYQPKRKTHFIKSNSSKRDKKTVTRNYSEDTVVSIGRDPPNAEFQGKTIDELEMELEFVTNKYEDCKKSRDYMATYYKDKKDILERMLGR